MGVEVIFWCATKSECLVPWGYKINDSDKNNIYRLQVVFTTAGMVYGNYMRVPYENCVLPLSFFVQQSQEFTSIIVCTFFYD